MILSIFSGCSCFHDTTWSANIIQCSARGHEKIPPLIPMDATSVFLDGNNFVDLSGQLFLGRSRMKSLYLNRSSVVNISNNTFVGLHDLQKLDLSNNYLQVLKGEEFAHLVNLKELFLQGNQLVQISQETFRPLTSLSTLRLDRNLLTTFPIWELASNTFIAGIYVAENAWTCDCDFLNKFRMFIDGNLDKVVDAVAVKCNINRFTEETYFQNNKSCVETGGGGFDSANTDLIFIILGAIIIVVTSVIAVIICRNQDAVKRILVARKVAVKGDLNHNSMYDLFVSYTPEDEHMALKMAETLESMKMCLQYRDLFKNSRNYKEISKVNAKSVIVILSNTYETLELEKTKDSILQILMNSSANLILITPQDTAATQHPDVKTLVNLSQAVLSWQEKQFWDNLILFLPAVKVEKLTSLPPVYSSSPSMSASTRTIVEDARSALNTPTIRSRPKSVFSAVESNSEFIYLTPKPKKARCLPGSAVHGDTFGHARSSSEIHRQESPVSIYHQRSKSGLTPANSKFRLAEPVQFVPPNHVQQQQQHNQQQHQPQNISQQQLLQSPPPPDPSDSRQLYGSTSFIYKLISSSASKNEGASPSAAPEDNRLYIQNKNIQHQRSHSLLSQASTLNNPNKRSIHKKSKSAILQKNAAFQDPQMGGGGPLYDPHAGGGGWNPNDPHQGGRGTLRESQSHSMLMLQNHLLSPQNPQQLLTEIPPHLQQHSQYFLPQQQQLQHQLLQQMPQHQLLQQMPQHILNSHNQQLTTQTLTRSFSHLNGANTANYNQGTFTTRRYPSQGFEGANASREGALAEPSVVHQRSKSTPYQGFVV